MFSRLLALLAIVFVGCAAPSAERDGEGDIDTDGAAIATVKTGYVTVRRDFRKCMFPMCGGYYVKAAEGAKLRCVDGSSALECYVPELQLTALKLTAAQNDTLQGALGSAILYGQIAPKTINGAAWGTFVVQKAWVAPNEGATKGALYFVSDNPTASGRKYQGVRLNYSARRTFDAIDFGAAPGSDAQWSEATTAAGTDAGVILGGAITGPTSAKLFEADQFFFRFPGKAVASCTEAIGAKVTAVSDGMTWPSESDYPIDFVSAAGAPSLEVARTLAGVSADTAVEERGFDDWFTHVVTAWDDDPISIANAERFRTLKSTLSDNLTDLKVYRFGSISIRVVIIGKTSCGTTAGIATTVIET